MGTLELTAILVSYNAGGRIGPAVKELDRAVRRHVAEVIVVDNASTDGSVAEAEAAVEGVRVIANRENLGYGPAANRALIQARGRLALIMNDDAFIDADSVDAMIDVIDSDPSIALVGPRVVGEDGSPMPAARVTFPGPGEELDRLRDRVRGVKSADRYPFSGGDAVDVAWLVGACIMGRTRLLIEHGGFNPAFFVYGEDIDLARRLKHLGYRVVTAPSATCVHIGAASTGSAFSTEARRRRRSDARDIYYRTWLPRPVRALVHLRQAIGLRDQPQRLLYHLPKVLYDGPGLAGLRRPPPLAGDGDRDEAYQGGDPGHA